MRRNAKLLIAALGLVSCRDLLGIGADRQIVSKVASSGEVDAGEMSATDSAGSEGTLARSDTAETWPTRLTPTQEESTSPEVSTGETVSATFGPGSGETSDRSGAPTGSPTDTFTGDSETGRAGTASGEQSSTRGGAASETLTAGESSDTETSGADEPCGNGRLDDGEACDDSNRESLDGCSASCQGEEGWALQVPGTLSPAFDPAIDEYHLRLPLGVRRVNMMVETPLGSIATVDDGPLTTAGWWTSDFLEYGETVMEIDVSDGTFSRTFTLVVERVEPEQLYFKASNAGSNDLFGESIALSADGNTLVVGAPQENSSVAVSADQEPDDAVENGGAVYVFARSDDGGWVQQTLLKAHMPGASDLFGESVAVSANGDRIVVGAPGESDGGRNIGNTEPTSNTAPSSGAAYVFERSSSGVWAQKAFIKASNSRQGMTFGHRVAMDAEGETIAVTADAESGSVGGVGTGEGTNTLAPGSGAAYVFVRGSSGAWSQQAYIKASEPGETDFFGESLALSGDGDTLAVGAHWEDSSVPGVVAGTNGGVGLDDDSTNGGAVYVFRRMGTAWAQQAFVKASNPGDYDEFGKSVALNFDGNVIAVGAYREGGAAVQVRPEPIPEDNALPNSGAVYVYEHNGETWAPVAYVKPNNPGSNDYFGFSTALSADGKVLAVGAYREDGNGTSLTDGSVFDDGSSDSGAVYLFQRTFSWTQTGYFKALNNDEGDFFGWSVALSADATRLAGGARAEQSDEGGLSANPNSNASTLVGAVYLWE